MARDPHRFRLHRAGILNVWQYDEQVFEFCDGRLLLRGTNGAGKSKTMEMLLPFVLDGDKARMTATGRQGSQLLWLMSDGATAGGTRTGYLWVELVRVDADGVTHVVTCGIGIRHSTSARQVTTWQFTVPTAVPALSEPDGTPLSAPRCRELVDALGGRTFDSPKGYKEHVGRLLFGLEPAAYDDLLRLLYWLRQPQVGEDIDPARLVAMLDESLPALDQEDVRQVGEALDELAEHGERVQRMRAAALAVAASAEVYARYAATLLRERAGTAWEADRERAGRARAVSVQEAAVARVTEELSAAETAEAAARAAAAEAASRVGALEAGPLARNQQVLREKQRRAEELASAAAVAAAVAARAGARAEDSAARVAREAGALAGLGADLSAGTTGTAALLRECSLDTTLPTAAAGVAQALALGPAVPLARQAVGTARAAVTVVREATRQLEQVTSRRDAAAARAAEAEGREEQAAGRLADTEREVERLAGTWSDATREWAAERGDLSALVDLPAPEPALLEVLSRAVREAVAPVLERLDGARAAAAARRVAATEQTGVLQVRRAATLAERDPAPPLPTLPRPDRDTSPGLPLWRVVDLGPSLGGSGTDVSGSGGATDGAAIEAALESAGLLDATVLADGSVLGPAALDTVLLAPPAAEEAAVAPLAALDTVLLAPPAAEEAAVAPLAAPPPLTLRAVLVADVPPDSPIEAATVTRLLDAVLLLPTVTGTDGSPAIGRDGSWRLGPAHGRAAKPSVQYIGAAAREAERARRLAEVDLLLEESGRELATATSDERAAADEIRGVRGWLDRLPSWSELRRAWVQSDERAAERDRAQAEAGRTARARDLVTEEMARAVESQRRLCAAHDLPADRAALDARDTELSQLDQRLRSLGEHGERLVDAARRLEEDTEAAERDQAEAELADAEAAAAVHARDGAAAESKALLDTLGIEVAAMQAELDQARRSLRTARESRDGAGHLVRELTGQAGEQRAGLEGVRRRLEDFGPQVAAAFVATAQLRRVPGLVEAGLGRPVHEHEALGLDGLDHVPAPRVALDLLRSWADLAVERPADANAVHAELRTLSVGPAADAEPRVVPVGEALSVLGRDSAGAERPLADLALRLTSEATREQDLLTEREHTLFEEHLLGELGDALRARSKEAADLVQGMNQLLTDVRTSQGIRVRLDWALREDVGPDVRAAVALLGRARGSLTPEESGRLRDALGALIEVQRSAEPERGYADHLAQALDYRRWSAFSVRLHRPGYEGWTTLTRRTPLSQGEQKVVCYLPLFAAAAAHFTSVAGAAPYAPRLILLDDAFPKIDVRTHPLLFGLLVDLDLDFVLTSERLWGDHPTVPSLAIYEALRAPGEPGIAQYHYIWDGNVLLGHG